MASAVITRLNLFQNRVLSVKASRAVSTPAGVTVGTRPRTASFGQAAAEPPQLFPFRDIAGADLQCFVQRQFSLDRLDVGRSFLDVRPGYIGTRRPPSHQFDVDRLALRREPAVHGSRGTPSLGHTPRTGTDGAAARMFLRWKSAISTAAAYSPAATFCAMPAWPRSSTGLLRPSSSMNFQPNRLSLTMAISQL